MNASINAIAKRYRYTGKERDEESGLYYHGARYYIPWLCRWCAVDALESEYTPQSPYVYCSNNPVNRIDEDGMSDDDAQKKYEEGEKRTKQMFQSKLSEVANSKADAEFKEWFADIGLKGLVSFRDRLFQSKVDSWQNNTLQRDWYGSEPDDPSKAYLDDTRRQQFWSDAIAETIPTLKSVWAAQQSGSTSGINFTHFRNLTVSNRQEGWDAIKSAGIQVGLEWALHIGLSGGAVYKGLKAVKQAVTETEVFYWAIPKESYNTFLQTGKMPAGSETFISPTKAFAKDYEGVLIQFNVKKGTTAQLEAIGVRNRALGHPNSQLPLVESGWKENNAFFKLETNKAGLKQVNIGLGNGKALDIFNKNIQNYKVIKR